MGVCPMTDNVWLVWDELGVESVWVDGDKAQERVTELRGRGVRAYTDNVEVSDVSIPVRGNNHRTGDVNTSECGTVCVR